MNIELSVHSDFFKLAIERIRLSRVHGIAKLPYEIGGLDSFGSMLSSHRRVSAPEAGHRYCFCYATASMVGDFPKPLKANGSNDSHIWARAASMPSGRVIFSAISVNDELRFGVAAQHASRIPCRAADSNYPDGRSRLFRFLAGVIPCRMSRPTIRTCKVCRIVESACVWPKHWMVLRANEEGVLPHHHAQDPKIRRADRVWAIGDLNRRMRMARTDYPVRPRTATGEFRVLMAAQVAPLK